MPMPACHGAGTVKNSSIISMHWQKIGRSGGKPHEIAILEGWCRRRDLNPRPPAYEADALPLSYAG
jgi:hypothetical protein